MSDQRREGTVAGKRAARTRALAARDALAPAERARLSAAICARAGTLPELRRARTVLLFASFRSEVDTGPLLAAMLGRGATVALPRVVAPRVLEAVRVTDPATDLAPGAWGIPEPRTGLAVLRPRELDAVVVPGAAFTAGGVRCGYGGGFYDAYLPQLRPGVPRVALAFEVQLTDDLPPAAHDVPVDVIVTERRTLRPR